MAKDWFFLPKIEKVGVIGAERLHRHIAKDRVGRKNINQPVDISIGQRVNQNCVHRAEHRRARAYTQGECKNRDYGKSGAPAKAP